MCRRNLEETSSSCRVGMDPEVNSGLCMEITITSQQQEFPGILGAAAVTL